MSTAQRSDTPVFDFDAWLRDTCRDSGVPLEVDDPAVVAKVAALLRGSGRARPP